MSKEYSCDVRISVIIVAYHSGDVISDCISSICKYNDIGSKLEVIVVDNSPDMPPYDFVEDLPINVKLIHNPANKGFGQGNNVGVAHASGDLLIFLNPDTILIEPVFDYALRFFSSNLKITSAGFLLVSRELQAVSTFAFLPEFNFLYLFAPFRFYYLCVVRFGLFSNIIFPWGANFVVRRDDFISAGMFDENIFLCNEEPDLVHRLSGGVRILNKKIIHLEGHTTRVPEARLLHWLNSTKYYFEKHKLDFKRFIYLEIIVNRIKILIKRILFIDTSINENYLDFLQRNT